MFADGSIMSRILGTLILIAIIGLPIYLVFRKRGSSWTGEVVDKESHVEEEDDDEDGGSTRTTVYNLKIKHAGSATIKTHSVTKGKYDQFEVGDNVIKQAGKMGFDKA